MEADADTRTTARAGTRDSRDVFLFVLVRVLNNDQRFLQNVQINERRYPNKTNAEKDANQNKKHPMAEAIFVFGTS